MQVCPEKLHDNREDGLLRDEGNECIVNRDTISETVVSVVGVVLAVLTSIARHESIADFNEFPKRIRIQHVPDDEIACVVKMAYVFIGEWMPVEINCCFVCVCHCFSSDVLERGQSFVFCSQCFVLYLTDRNTVARVGCLKRLENGFCQKRWR